ncbi:ribonuclease Z [Parablautia sp. Marseille-Q6255]|uniref:ribonuclease Z n=1 Tax=Parablautia sp. Marseille-Q6255 TaxID=3039593 RepID=UPI0024BD5903|nr:ribonuclease Z [Parablautia sp. Marseille-Q6255]
MIIIAAIDNRNGLMFNHRRQSQDKNLCKKILEITSNSKLWVNHYTEKQFANISCCPQLNIDDNLLNEAAPGEYCFIENVSLKKSEAWIEKIILFKWNRNYPGDFFFDIDLANGNWKLKYSENFTGSSHEMITMEVYDRLLPIL